MDDAELLKAFKSIKDVAWYLLDSGNPIGQATLKRLLKPLDEVIEGLELNSLKKQEVGE